MNIDRLCIDWIAAEVDVTVLRDDRSCFCSRKVEVRTPKGGKLTIHNFPDFVAEVAADHPCIKDSNCEVDFESDDSYLGGEPFVCVMASNDASEEDVNKFLDDLAERVKKTK